MLRLSKTRFGLLAVLAGLTVLALLQLMVLMMAPAEAISCTAAKTPCFLGSLLSSQESTTTSWSRDGGISVPLPNGKDFWVFGDTPRNQWQTGSKGTMWYLNLFITGSTAGEINFTGGQPLSGRFTELMAGSGAKALNPNNQPTRFMPVPKLYKPDGSACQKNKYDLNDSTDPGRWPTGAALMPDKTNILITYLGACANSQSFVTEAWGFALYNWKTNKFTVLAKDVFPAHPDASPLQRNRFFGTPIIIGKNLTLYSWADGHIYATTMAATTKAMMDPASYNPRIIPGVPGNVPFSVSPPSRTQPDLTMLQMTDSKGGYQILSSAASKPTGPWKVIGKGVLPKCDASSSACITPALHPELSPKHKIMATYYLPGYGTFKNNQPSSDPHFGHLVMTYLPD